MNERELDGMVQGYNRLSEEDKDRFVLAMLAVVRKMGEAFEAERERKVYRLSAGSSIIDACWKDVRR